MSTARARVWLWADEVPQLGDVLDQFETLIAPHAEPGAGPDPAVARLMPDAYADADSATEFRRLTANDLITRRLDDIATVRDSLGSVEADPTDADRVGIDLDADQVHAWMRTLNAVRLVVAVRLGIIDDDTHTPGDPAFTLFDWLGYRLDTVVNAATQLRRPN